MSAATPPARHVEIGQRVRAIRLKKRIRQVDLAAAASMSWRHLIRIEQGEGGQPKPETLGRIAGALGIERSELDGGEDDEDPHPVSLDEFLQRLVDAKVDARLRFLTEEVPT